MKLSLIKEQGPCPPEGFRYVDPVDGFVTHAWTYNDWVALHRSHLQANGRAEPDHLESLMQDQLCRTLPPGWCNYDDPNRPRPTVSLDWGTVANGLKTFSNWILNGCHFVTQAEADRRANICSRCYYNVNISGCSACQKAVAETIGSRRTKFDYSLKGCAVCRCVLRAKVWFPQSILDKENERLQEQYPDFCWLKRTGDNYRG